MIDRILKTYGEVNTTANGYPPENNRCSNSSLITIDTLLLRSFCYAIVYTLLRTYLNTIMVFPSLQVKAKVSGIVSPTLATWIMEPMGTQHVTVTMNTNRTSDISRKSG